MAVSSKKRYVEGIGSRKRSSCRVRVYEGTETSVINGVPVEEYFKGHEKLQNTLKRPLIVAGLVDKLFFSAKVIGGGTTGQAGAIRMGLARALAGFDNAVRPVLAKEGLLSRDSREVERKKYFLRKARKKPQFSKR